MSTSVTAHSTLCCGSCEHSLIRPDIPGPETPSFPELLLSNDALLASEANVVESQLFLLRVPESHKSTMRSAASKRCAMCNDPHISHTTTPTRTSVRDIPVVTAGNMSSVLRVVDDVFSREERGIASGASVNHGIIGSSPSTTPPALGLTTIEIASHNGNHLFGDLATAIEPSSKSSSMQEPNSILSASQSTLATAQIIEDINNVSYPEGVSSPKVELNINAKDSKFKQVLTTILLTLILTTPSRYDRDFLLQFMTICKEKPDVLLPLDTIGLDPRGVQRFSSLVRGGAGRHKTVSAVGQPGPRSASIGLGVVNFTKPRAVGSFSVDNFPTPSGSGSLSREERFALASNNRAVSAEDSPNIHFHPSPMVHTTNPSGGQIGVKVKRTRTKRKGKQSDSNKGQGHLIGPQ